MKKFIIILLLLVAQNQILASLTIRKGTDTGGVGIGTTGIFISQQGVSGPPPVPGGYLLMETDDYLLLESSDKIIME